MPAHKGNKTAVGNNGGRPSKYKPEYCDKIIEHFDITPFSDKVSIHGPIPNLFPTFERFAHSIGVHRDTLHEWCTKHKEFSDAYKRAHDLQFAVYQEGVMSKAWNSTFAIFLGKNIFDLVDKKDVNLDANVRDITVKLPEEIDEEEE